MSSDPPSSQPPAAGDDATRPTAAKSLGSGSHIWLVRHAEVHEDWQGKAYGDLDVPLSETGQQTSFERAQDFAQLRPAYLACSPLQRARHLAEELERRSPATLVVHEDLREIHRGRWQGQTVADLHAKEAEAVRAFYADPWNWRGHGGENDSMLADRVWPICLNAVKHAGGGTAVLVAHYNVIRVACAVALGIPRHRSFALRVDPGRSVLLVDQAAGWLLSRANVLDPRPATDAT